MGKPRLPENSYRLIIPLITVRIFSAIYNLIYDCDETYNYWEVGHYLIYGNGYVTWEYSPRYALRSFLYIWTYIWPSWILSFLTSNEVILFYFTRIATACFGAFCEIYFCIGLGRCGGTSVFRYCLAFLLMSSGLYFASTAFLPNTLSMHFTMITFGAWFCDQYKMTIFSAGLSILLGWPYAAIVYIPIALSMLLSRKRNLFFIFSSILYGIMILTPLILVDTYYYGRIVIAPINTILYNVFSSKVGPELYGVEGLPFYFINLLLNFNLVFVASLFSLPMLILSKIFITAHKHKMLESSHLICVTSMLLWLIIFSLQPHKEERFMYPIYPLICASAALATKTIEKFVVGTKRPYSSPVFKVIVYLLCLAFLGLSLSRVISVHNGFRSTMDVFSDLKIHDRNHEFSPNFNYQTNDKQTAINVCYGKEWYRYPNSFFLPSSTRYRTKFIKSTFKGQLPKLYEPSLQDQKQMKTRIIFEDFNDMNKEEMSRYTPIENCHYLIDSSQPNPTSEEPDYSKDTNNWSILSSYDMLDLATSPMIIRSFYLPFISERQNVYIKYQLLRNNNLFTNNKSSSKT